MAASIMLAIGAVAWTMHVNNTATIHPSPLAKYIKPAPGLSHEVVHEAATSNESTSDFQAVADASSDEVDARVSYLLEADRMSSLDDVQKEIAMLVSMNVH